MSKGKYPDEETLLHKKYKARRSRGMEVDYEWLKGKMKFIVKNSGKILKKSSRLPIDGLADS